MKTLKDLCIYGIIVNFKFKTALMKKMIKLIKNTFRKYTGNCPKCGAYYLDDEEVYQICGWPYTN